MENIRETAELIFTTSDGTRTIRIPNPIANVTQFMLNAAASRLILANPFDETIGDLEKLKDAYRVIVSRTQLLPEAS